MELSIHSPVPHTIYFQFEPEPCAVNNHLECEVEVVKLDPSRCCQPCEQATGHGIQVGRQRTYVYEVSSVSLGWLICFASNEVVRNDQRLARSEIARVVESNGTER